MVYPTRIILHFYCKLKNLLDIRSKRKGKKIAGWLFLTSWKPTEKEVLKTIINEKRITTKKLNEENLTYKCYIQYPYFPHNAFSWPISTKVSRTITMRTHTISLISFRAIRGSRTSSSSRVRWILHPTINSRFESTYTRNNQSSHYTTWEIWQTKLTLKLKQFSKKK